MYVDMWLNLNEDDNQSQNMLKWIGLAIVIGSALLSNLGVNIQKISHDTVRSFEWNFELI